MGSVMAGLCGLAIPALPRGVVPCPVGAGKPRFLGQIHDSFVYEADNLDDCVAHHRDQYPEMWAYWDKLKGGNVCQDYTRQG
jgi:hypothetical protein